VTCATFLLCLVFAIEEGFDEEQVEEAIEEEPRILDVFVDLWDPHSRFS
jgi:hypothetical protein